MVNGQLPRFSGPERCLVRGMFFGLGAAGLAFRAVSLAGSLLKQGAETLSIQMDVERQAWNHKREVRKKKSKARFWGALED